MCSSCVDDGLEQLNIPSSIEVSADPFTYTSGRWLHHDQAQREARFLKFDFPLLCQKAIDTCPGARRVLRYEKKEGGFNRVFVLHMDNGARVIARVPFRIAGPRCLTTHSEVATMSYVASHTNIPVPKVLDWNADYTNPVGVEYIIMQCAPGVQLHQVWPTMSCHQHMLVTKALAQAIMEMTNLEFSSYGSLYFEHTIPVAKGESHELLDFVVGRHCGREFWNCVGAEQEHYCGELKNRGPWTTLADYVMGLADSSRLQLSTNRLKANNHTSWSSSLSEYLRLLSAGQAVLKELVKNPSICKVSRAMLLHPDLNKRNIFVSPEDPTRITAIIDWQSTCIEPAFVYANETPDLITPPPSLSSIPEMDEDLAGELYGEKEDRRLEQDYWICRQTFEIFLRAYSPTLAAARATDETLLRLFRCFHSSWKDETQILRQELIELSQRWTDLGLPGLCPYQPSAEIIASHAKEWEHFETAQKLKVFLMRTLDTTSEGWVPSDGWRAAKEAHRAAFEQWMEAVKESDDPEMTQSEGLKLWPWNER